MRTDNYVGAADGQYDWRSEPATPNQLKYMKSLGVKARPGLTKGDAADLIGEAKEKIKHSPASEKQERLLKRENEWQEGMTRGEAHERIQKLSERWKN